MSNESIGARIRRLRKERGLRIVDLAKLVHSNETTIQQLERGTHATNMFTFIEIARALGVSLDYLAYGTITVTV